jgi:hypothetical protein
MGAKQERYVKSKRLATDAIKGELVSLDTETRERAEELLFSPLKGDIARERARRPRHPPRAAQAISGGYDRSLVPKSPPAPLRAVQDALEYYNGRGIPYGWNDFTVTDIKRPVPLGKGSVAFPVAWDDRKRQSWRRRQGLVQPVGHAGRKAVDTIIRNFDLNAPEVH